MGFQEEILALEYLQTRVLLEQTAPTVKVKPSLAPWEKATALEATALGTEVLSESWRLSIFLVVVRSCFLLIPGCLECRAGRVLQESLRHESLIRRSVLDVLNQSRESRSFLL